MVKKNTTITDDKDIISGIKHRLKSDAGKKIAAVVAVILLVAIIASYAF